MKKYIFLDFSWVMTRSEKKTDRGFIYVFIRFRVTSVKSFWPQDPVNMTLTMERVRLETNGSVRSAVGRIRLEVWPTGSPGGFPGWDGRSPVRRDIIHTHILTFILSTLWTININMTENACKEREKKKCPAKRVTKNLTTMFIILKSF